MQGGSFKAVLLLSMAAGTLPGGASAQSPPPARFPTDVELVYVTVGVQGREGSPAPPLEAGDFVLRDDGRERPVEVVIRAGGAATDERQAIDVCVLADTSGSMTKHIQDLTLASIRILDRIPLIRRRCVISFDNDVRVWRPEASPTELLADIVAARRTNGATALRTALVTGVKQMEDTTARTAIVLLSDGEDVGSRVTAAETTRALEGSRVTVYALAHGAEADQWSGGNPADHLTKRYTGPAFLSQIANASGGRVFTPDDGDIEKALAHIVTDLSSQYVLGFSPLGRTGRHRLDVKVRRKDVRVRHRPTYVLLRDPVTPLG